MFRRKGKWRSGGRLEWARRSQATKCRVGTDDDPQNLKLQTDQFMDAQVKVVHTASNAVEYLSLWMRAGEKKEFTLVNLGQLKEPFAALNVGLESFYDSLIIQGARAVQVEWRPPAGGNEKLGSLLARMKT